MPKINLTQTLQNQICQLIDIAEKRHISLPETQALFKSVDSFLTARSHDGLRNKVNSENNVSLLQTLNNKLKDFVNSHIMYDDKSLTILECSNLKKFQNKLDKYFEVERENPNKFESYKKVELDENLIAYQFIVDREILQREKLSLNILTEEVSEEYDEIIGIKRIPIICHDFLILDMSKNFIIVGIDLVTILGANELKNARAEFFSFLKKEFDLNAIDDSIDFFSQIQGFYDLPNADNGIVNITFMTPAGTTHHEELKGKGKDLREATYHEAGVKGVRGEKKNGKLLNNDITPYSITSRFYRVDKKSIDISLKSNYIAINTPNGQHLYEARIYGTRTLEDLGFVINKLTG